MTAVAARRLLCILLDSVCVSSFVVYVCTCLGNENHFDNSFKLENSDQILRFFFPHFYFIFFSLSFFHGPGGADAHLELLAPGHDPRWPLRTKALAKVISPKTCRTGGLSNVSCSAWPKSRFAVVTKRLELSEMKMVMVCTYKK